MNLARKESNIARNLLGREFKTVKARKANCWDNAPMESFFSILKQETNLSQILSFSKLNNYMNKYLDYYNNERPKLSVN